MNCSEASSLFTAHFERDLGDTEQAAVEAHLRACPACVQEFQQVAAATRALRSLPIAPSDPATVAGILAAVTSDERRRAHRRRAVLSHALTATLSAAAAVLLLLLLRGPPATPAEPQFVALSPSQPPSQSPSPSPSPSSPQPAAAAPEEPLRCLPIRTQLTGHTESSQSSEVIQLAPGERWTSSWFPELSLQRNETGELIIETRLDPPPEPRIVERVVERVEYVSVTPLELDLQQVAEMLDQTRETLSLVPRSMLAWVRRGLDSPRATAVSETTVPVHEAGPGTSPPANALASSPPRPLAGAAIAAHLTQTRVTAVSILDQEGTLRLEIRGPVAATLPALIAHLDDADPRVVELVRRRLEMLREEHFPDSPVPDAPPADRPTTPDWLGLVGPFPTSTAAPEDLRSLRERWSDWWFEQSRGLGLRQALELL